MSTLGWGPQAQAAATPPSVAPRRLLRRLGLIVDILLRVYEILFRRRGNVSGVLFFGDVCVIVAGGAAEERGAAAFFVAHDIGECLTGGEFDHGDSARQQHKHQRDRTDDPFWSVAGDHLRPGPSPAAGS